MRIEFDILTRKTKYLHSFDLMLSEEDLFCLFQGVRDEIPYDEIAVASVIKEELVAKYNRVNRRKIKPDEISYHLEFLQEHAVKNADDIEALIKHKDSMVIRRGDGSQVSVTEEYGLIKLKDSRKPGEIHTMTAETVLSRII